MKKLDKKYWMTNLKPFGDADNDGKSNMMDCYPLDPNRQGISEIVKSAKTKIGAFKEERKQQQFEQAVKRETYTYIIIKYIDGPWQSVGAFTVDDIGFEVNKYRTASNVEQVITSKDPKKADQLNRKLMVQHAKEKGAEFKKGVATVARGLDEQTQEAGFRKASQNIKQATAVAPAGKAAMSTFATGPSGANVKPPASEGWWGSMQKRVTDRSDYQGGHPFKSEERRLPVREERRPPERREQSFGEVEAFERATEPEPEQEFGTEERGRRPQPKRSKYYQERSNFYNYEANEGRGRENCVPYRPVSRSECTLMNPIKKYHYPPSPVYRPSGNNMGFGTTRPKGATLSIKPIKAKFKFIKRI